jgi:hypothetical protein
MAGMKHIGRAAVSFTGLLLVGSAAATLASCSSNQPSREEEARAAFAAFFKAFNRHDAGAALDFFARDSRSGNVGANDCDFRHKRTVRFIGRADVAQWLHQRAADHDQLTVRSIRIIANDVSPVAGAGVTYSRRTSDTLKSLGFATGITRGLASKIAFTVRGRVRLSQFANAAGGGRPCSPMNPIGR